MAVHPAGEQIETVWSPSFFCIRGYLRNPWSDRTAAFRFIPSHCAFTLTCTVVAGIGHLDTFAWIGAFSAAPNTKPPEQLVPDPAVAKAQLKLLYISCGNKDGLINFSQRTHRYLKEHGVPHLWNVDDHGHDGETWGSNLYHFAQRVFR